MSKQEKSSNILAILFAGYLMVFVIVYALVMLVKEVKTDNAKGQKLERKSE